MITVRFFTGVTVEYKDATKARPLSDGSIQICTGEKDVLMPIALIQPTAGAVIELVDGIGKMYHPAIKNGKYPWAK